MTGNGHRMTGIGAAFMAAAIARLTGSPEIVAAALAAVSTTIPDWIEVPLFRNGVRVGTLITHRTLTHWPPIWLALIAWGCFNPDAFGAAAIAIGVGSMVHILGDAPNPMGIPWFWPTKRLKLGKKGWWKSGEHEFLMILFFAAVGFAVWRLTGGTIPGFENFWKI